MPGLDRFKAQSTGNTTHISVIDEEGNAAGITTSNGEGCGFMIPGTGVMMNNMLGEEDTNPHGFHAQHPGTRMSSMMAPTIVMEGKKIEVVLGSGGSRRIRTAILQVLLNILDHKLPLFEAINNPRLQWEDGVFHVEKGIDEPSLNALEKEGVVLNKWSEKNTFFGGVHTVIMDDKGKIVGCGDLRRGGVCNT